MNTTRGVEAPVELAARANGELDVLLLWDRRSGRLWVDVLHVRTGRRFAVETDSVNALDAFYHPFAYRHKFR